MFNIDSSKHYELISGYGCFIALIVFLCFFAAKLALILKERAKRKTQQETSGRHAPYSQSQKSNGAHYEGADPKKNDHTDYGFSNEEGGIKHSAENLSHQSLLRCEGEGEKEYAFEVDEQDEELIERYRHTSRRKIETIMASSLIIIDTYNENLFSEESEYERRRCEADKLMEKLRTSY